MVSRVVCLVLALLMLSSCDESEEEKRKNEAEKVEMEAKRIEDKRKGFHCLSGWDGSLYDLKRYTEQLMRNPESFEHMETRITPVSGDGTHRVTMTYRAQNGFGGMSIGYATATVRNQDCSMYDVVVE